MNLRKRILPLGLPLLILTSQASLHAQDKSITIKGSDTMVLLGQRWAEVYMKKNPDSRIQVTGGGSGISWAACKAFARAAQRLARCGPTKWGTASLP